jgi:hypothetical protein
MNLTRTRLLIAAGVTITVAAGGAGIALAATRASNTTHPVAGAAPKASAPATPAASSASSAIFTDTCRLTKVAAIDPLLMPGMTGMSMEHDFFGNTQVSANSTPATVRGGTSTCSTSADASAYWAPVLYQNGQVLTPGTPLIYWRAPGKDASTTQTMPRGISMIAGDEKASAPQQGIVHWQCTNTEKTAKPTTVPQSCSGSGQIRMVVDFPSCWNGSDLSGAAQTNVVYPSARGACPTGHPDRIPQIVFHLIYPTRSATGLAFSTGPGASGSTDTAHVDFLDGWNQTLFDRDFTTCVTGGKACGQASGTDATLAHPDDLVPPGSPKATARNPQPAPPGGHHRRSTHAAV